MCTSSCIIFRKKCLKINVFERKTEKIDFSEYFFMDFKTPFIETKEECRQKGPSYLKSTKQPIRYLEGLSSFFFFDSYLKQ